MSPPFDTYWTFVNPLGIIIKVEIICTILGEGTIYLCQDTDGYRYLISRQQLTKTNEKVLVK